MKKCFPIVAMLVAVSLAGCDVANDLASTQGTALEDVAGKGTVHEAYSMVWPFPAELYVPCLDETIGFTGYSLFTGFYQVTPSGHYIDMSHMDVNTDDPYVMVFPDGTEWPVASGEGNSLVLQKAQGQGPGRVTAQANLVFRSPDGKSRVKYRAHYVADGVNWDTGELTGIQKMEDIFKCHFAE